MPGRPYDGGFDSDRLGVAVGRLEQLETEGRDVLREAELIYTEIDYAIRKIQGRNKQRKQIVLQLRYLDLCKWGVVTGIVFGKLDDFDEKEENYLRQVMKIHPSALLDICGIIEN